MTQKRAFISFDFDNDEELRDTLVGQANNSDSPFNIHDESLRKAYTSKWKQVVREHIRRSDLAIVICGKHTDVAKGVEIELTIVREEEKPYFLLRGRPKETCTRPKQALADDAMQDWTWKNLKRLIAKTK